MDNQIRSSLDKFKPDIRHLRSKAAFKPVKREETIEIDGKEYKLRYYEWIISNDSVDSYGTIMDPETTLPNFARDAAAGVPIQKNHNYQQMQLGLSTDGMFDGESNEVRAEGYIQEGLVDVGSDDVIARLDTGTGRWVSVGFDDYREECTICGEEMHWFWGDCKNGHWLFDEVMFTKDGYETDDPEKAVRNETVYAKVVDARLIEFSPVWRGATPGAELIGAVRALYEEGKVEDRQFKRLKHHFGYDVRSLVVNPKRRRGLDPKPNRTGEPRSHRTDEPRPQRRKTMAEPTTFTQEEHIELLADYEEAERQIVELKKRPTVEEHERKVAEFTDQIADNEKEITQLRDEAKKSDDLSQESELAVIALRQDVLDAYADAASLDKYQRDTDEGYIKVKEQVEETDSLMRLINKRRHYEIRGNITGGRRSRTGAEPSKAPEKDPPFGYPGSDAYQ